MTELLASKQDLNFKKIAERMIGAARLSRETFSELRDDQSATIQSVSLIPIIGFCYGSGLGFFGYLVGQFNLAETLLVILGSLGSAAVISLIWSAASFLTVTRLFHRTINYWGLTRPLLFSWTPGLLFIVLLTPIPIVSDLFRIAVTAWIAIASIFAVKHAAGLSLQQSMLTFIMSILILVLAQAILGSVLALFLT